mgnify:FL=1
MSTTSTIPPAARELVQACEGLRLAGYLCPAGIPTIGWGHTGPEVRVGMTVTRTQAEAWLDLDLSGAAAAVDRLVTVPLTEGQRAALISFAFNLGQGALRTSTLLKKLNKGDAAGAADQFALWVKASVTRQGRTVKETLPGLVKRRRAEAALFRGEDWRAAFDDTGATTSAVEPAIKPLARSVTVQTGAGGLGLAGVVLAVQELRDTHDALKGAFDGLPAGNAGWLAAGVLALAVGVMLYRRWDDQRKAG